jgi:prepilin-type N-terminal cleavage/methylation domain-containing protein
MKKLSSSIYSLFYSFFVKKRYKKVAIASKSKRSPNLASALGFTLIEILVVLAMVGVLTAIAAPGWSGFINTQRLNSAQSRAFSTLRLAQSNAKREQIMWQATFRNTPNAAQYAVHKTPTSATNEAYWNALPWQNFDEGVRIVENTENEPRTTFTKLTDDPEPDVYRVQFKSQGSPNGLGELGRITFVNRVGDRKKCVIISTILGSMRVAENTNCNQT